MADDKRPKNLESSSEKRIKNISSVSDAMIRQSKLAESRAKTSSMIEAKGTVTDARTAISNVDKILKGLSKSTELLAGGIKHITVETAKGVKGITTGGAKAVSEYARAVSEDININKQSLMVTTIGKISPIVGYAVAKMMDTTVFKNMIAKMKEGLGKALGSVKTKFASLAGAGWTRLKEFGASIRDKFTRSKKEPKIKELADIRASLADKANTAKTEKAVENAIDKKLKKQVPAMAEGGYVEKAGLAKVHAAEIVQPVDEVVEVIVEQVSKRMDAKDRLMKARKDDPLSVASKSITQNVEVLKEKTLSFQHSIHQGLDVQKSAMVDSFKEAMNVGKGSQSPHERSAEHLAAIRSQIAPFRLIAATWQNFLSKSPWIRASLAFFSANMRALTSPLRFLFRKRGMGAPNFGKGNIFTQSGALFGSLYWKLQEVAENTDASVNALVEVVKATTNDQSYTKQHAVQGKGYTIAGKLWRGLVGGVSWLSKKLLPKAISDYLTKERTLMGGAKWAGGKAKQAAMAGYEKLPAGLRDKVAGAKQRVKETKEEYTRLFKQRMEEERQGFWEFLGTFGVKSPEQREAEKKRREILFRKFVPFSKKAESVTAESQAKDAEKSQRKNITAFLSKIIKGIYEIVSVSSGINKVLERIAKASKTRTTIQKKEIVISNKALKQTKSIRSLNETSNRRMKRLARRFKSSAIFKWIMTAVGFIKTLFMGAFGKVKAMLAGVLGAGGLAKIGAALGKFAGPALGVAAAGAIGYAIGTKINKHVVDPIVKHYEKKGREREKKLETSNLDYSLKGRKALKSGKLSDKDFYKERMRIDLATHFGKTAKEREKSYGFTTRRTIFYEIQQAQQKYMNENMAEYSKYHPDDILQLRRQFATNHWTRAKGFTESPTEYGLSREAAFLKYLKKHGSVAEAGRIEKKYDRKRYEKIHGISEEGKKWKEELRAKQQYTAKVIKESTAILGPIPGFAGYLTSEVLINNPNMAVKAAESVIKVGQSVKYGVTAAHVAMSKAIVALKKPLMESTGAVKSKVVAAILAGETKVKGLTKSGTAWALEAKKKGEDILKKVTATTDEGGFVSPDLAAKAKAIKDTTAEKAKEGKAKLVELGATAKKKFTNAIDAVAFYVAEISNRATGIYDILAEIYRRKFNEEPPTVTARTGMGFISKGSPSFRLQMHDGEVGFISPTDAQERLGLMGGLNSKQVASMGASQELFRAGLMKTLVDETRGVKGAMNNATNANAAMFTTIMDNSNRTANTMNGGGGQGEGNFRRDSDIDDLLAAAVF